LFDAGESELSFRWPGQLGPGHQLLELVRLGPGHQLPELGQLEPGQQLLELGQLGPGQQLLELGQRGPEQLGRLWELPVRYGHPLSAELFPDLCHNQGQTTEQQRGQRRLTAFSLSFIQLIKNVTKITQQFLVITNYNMTRN
jgi:hypothetical protein